MKNIVPKIPGSLLLYGCCLGTVLAAVLAWAGRYEMNQDGMSYADMAVGSLQEGPGRLVNQLWSPAYPAFLSLILGLFHPVPAHEFAVLHGANFLIFLFALGGFVFFIRRWSPPGPASPAFQAFGLSIFLWYALKRIGLSLATPDLMVIGMVFFTAGSALQLRDPQRGLRAYAFFGFILGLGYYVKAPLLPFNLALLLLLFVIPPAFSDRKRLCLSLAVFLATLLPLTAALSRQAGHWTLGEAGTYNYLLHVDHLDFADLEGRLDPSFGAPSDPPGMLARDPLTIEFARPGQGTYPLHYDPSPWYKGLHPAFSTGRQWEALENNRRPYEVFFLESLLCLAGALVLLAARLRPTSSGPGKEWAAFALWSLAALAIYAPIHTESRYLAPFSALFWLALYRPLVEMAKPPARTVVPWSIAALFLLTLAARIQPAIGEIRTIDHPGYKPDYIQELEAAQAAGLRPGDPLAVVGPAGDCYFAHLGKFKIVAQTFNTEGFQSLGQKQLAAYDGLLKAHGIKVVFLEGTPPPAGEKGWKRITASTSLFIL